MLGSLPPNKGVSPYTADLVDAVSALPDVDLEVITFSSIYPSWLYPGGEPDERGLVREFPLARVRRLLAWYNPLSWIWAGLTLRGDVVHAQWWSFVLAPVYATVLALARLRGKRVVLTLHNVEPHEKSKLKRFLNAALLSFAHRVVVHSEANRAQLVARGARVPAALIPMAAGVAGAERPSRGEARMRLGLPQGARVVLYFGNIRPYKGVDVLLRAFAVVAEAVPDALLVIAGKPWGSWQPYQDQIRELGLEGRVRLYLDYVPTPEVPLYFEAADVVALPYLEFEAQSAVGSLALAYGKPMVVSDAGGLPDLVREQSSVVKAGSVADLAATLSRNLTCPELLERLAQDSRELAVRYSAESVAARTAELYREALA
jgi:glycosyltransferase involved in cell wall biosynthesis